MIEMEQKKETIEAPQKPAKRKFKFASLLLPLVFASGLFFTGYGLGSGRITFGNQGNISISRLPSEIDFTSVEELYKTLQENYDGEVDINKLIDGMKSGLAQSTGDPYTEYFNVEASEEFNEQLSGTFSGIGAELGKDGEKLIVISPIADFPAAKAGVMTKDVIITVNDESTVGLTVSQAVDKIRGETGTTVKLGIVRNESEVLNLDITRAQINIPSVKWEVKDGVGIIKVARFWDDTASLTEQAADEFSKAGINKVVLDMRGNPGGALNSAVELSSMWLDKGSIVLREKQGDKVINTLYASGNQKFKNYQTVVLIDEGSASASEITAGALRDNNKATLIGVKSYGKGSVQQVIPLNSGGTLKVTVARWYTPNDKNIDKEGISPDQEVKRTVDDIKNNIDPQLDAAIVKLKGS
ncbi:MAG: S41 family peptidase [bacterium]|nr:S41 family peptidase [bacterium]